jgi:hypothetical protein
VLFTQTNLRRTPAFTYINSTEIETTVIRHFHP